MTDWDKLFLAAVERRASDLHLKPGLPPVLRIHGALVPQPDLGVITAAFMDQLARHVLAESGYGRLMESQEVDAAHSLPNAERFRVNMYLAQGQVRAVLRVIPTTKPTFDELGLPPTLVKLCDERRGLVLVTGITGSGKSTTLAAMIDHINRHRTDHIITIEDPVEFIHDDAATALRAALREDPDVILVGEMRDPETMAVALHAAATGHLVLSTLHTLNATETVHRIIGAFPPHQARQVRDQLADVLAGIVSQRLIVRRDDPGRVPVVEVMIGTALIRDYIRDGKRTADIPAVIAAGRLAYGMQTFDQCLLDLYHDGVISLEAAREAATNAGDFDLKVRGILSASEMTTDGATLKRA